MRKKKSSVVQKNVPSFLWKTLPTEHTQNQIEHEEGTDHNEGHKVDEIERSTQGIVGLRRRGQRFKSALHFNCILLKFPDGPPFIFIVLQLPSSTRIPSQPHVERVHCTSHHHHACASFNESRLLFYGAICWILKKCLGLLKIVEPNQRPFKRPC